jgi:hypothetical protein
MAAVNGQTRESAEELRKLYAELWQLEDAATAAAAAAEAMAAAQQLMDDANVRIADLMDPAGAQQRAREREIAEAIKGQTPETAAELRRLYETLYGLEDAATAATAAAEALARAQEQKADLEMRYLDLTGSDAEILAARRAKERAETEQTNWALLDLIYAREDEVAAMERQSAILAEREGLMVRLAEASGNSAEVTRLQREMELREALDDGNRAILRQIYVLEDARVAMESAIASEYEARIASIESQDKAASAAHDATMARLDKQRDAAQEALSLAEGLLSTIQSALDSMRGQQAYDEMTHARAARQLAAWAKANTLPDVDHLGRVMDVLIKAEQQDFASEAAWKTSQQATLSGLLSLEGRAVKEVNWAEKQVQAIESQIDALNGFNDRTQANLQAQREQAEAWRDEQMDGINAILQALLQSEQGYDTGIGLSSAPPQYDTGNNSSSAPPHAEPLLLPISNPYFAAAADQTNEIKALKAELILLRKDMAAAQTATVAPLKSLDDRTKKWDLDGLPAPRDDGTSTTMVLMRAA